MRLYIVAIANRSGADSWYFHGAIAAANAFSLALLAASPELPMRERGLLGAIRALQPGERYRAENVSPDEPNPPYIVSVTRIK